MALVELRSITSKLVSNLLLLGDSQSVDAKERANASDDEMGPASVDNKGDKEVGPHVVKLQSSADLGEAKARHVGQDSTANKGPDHDGPVGERLAGKMGEDHLGGKASENKRHGNAEEYQVVVRHQRAVWRREPEANGRSKSNDSAPLHENGCNRKVVGVASFDDVVNAERNVGEDHGNNDQTNPDISERCLANHAMQTGQSVAKQVNDGLGPNLGTPDSGNNHHEASNEDTLSRAVDVAEIERMGVVGLPGREEHWQDWAEGSEDTSWRSAQAHGSRFQQTGQCTVERVDAVVEELAETARCSGSSSLLSIDVVHGLVHEEAESKAEVDP